MLGSTAIWGVILPLGWLIRFQLGPLGGDPMEAAGRDPLADGLLDLGKHFWGDPCLDRGQRLLTPFAVGLDVAQQSIHFRDFADLTGYDLVGELADTGIADACFSRVVDGDGVVRDHRPHECRVADQGLASVGGKQG